LEERIELVKKLKIMLQGHTYIGEEKKEGWKEPTSIYMFKCPKHGYVKSNVKGYEERLECPFCLEEMIEFRVTA
jgi:hypothetical protein